MTMTMIEQKDTMNQTATSPSPTTPFPPHDDDSNHAIAAAAVFVFHACPPSLQRFDAASLQESTGAGNQTLIGAFTTTRNGEGRSKENKEEPATALLMCGRESGLQLRLQSSQVFLTANTTANLIDANGFSLSLLFRPGKTSIQDGLQTILTITITTSNSEEDYDYALPEEDGCRGHLLQIGQYGPHVLLRFRDASAACRVLLLRNTFDLMEEAMSSSSSPEKGSPLALSLLTVTANTTHTTIYMNETMIGQSNGLDLSSNNLSREIRLFASQDEDIDHFQGALYRLAVYNETLPSAPATNATIHWLDEAEAFPIFNLEGAMEPPPLVIQQGSNETFSVVVTPPPEYPRLELRIISLPDKGLLNVEGEEIVTGFGLNPTTKELKYTMTDSLYFNTPQINANGVGLNVTDEFFTYQLLAFDDDGYVVAQSNVLKCSIIVQLVNHRPVLDAPRQVQVGSASKSGIVPNVKVLDTLDHDVNLVRVDVSSRRGSLTVATEEAKSIILRHQYDCSGRSASPWQCTGDGIRDRLLVVVATPTDVTRILEGLQYTSLAPGRLEADNVTVAIYDGQGGDCLTADEHWSYQQSLGNSYPSLHPNGCVKIQADIQVPGVTVESTGGGHGPDVYGYGSDSVLPDLLFWTIFIMVLCCFCGSRLRKCALRGSSIDADGGSDDEEDDYVEETQRGGNRVVFPRVVRDIPLDYDVPTDDSIASSIYWDEFSVA